MVAEKTKIDVETASRITKFLALDVATRYTGYAMFNRVSDKLFCLQQFGNVTANNKDWRVRCGHQAGILYHILTELKPMMILMEYPSFQGGEKGSHASRGGDTLKLAYLCGMFEQVYMMYLYQGKHITDELKAEFLPAQLVTYSIWNGQLPKDVTCHRLSQHFGFVANPNSPDNNWADAVMMGKWFVEEIGLNVVGSVGAGINVPRPIGVNY